MNIEVIAILVTYLSVLFFVSFVIYLIVLSYRDDKKSNELFIAGSKKSIFLKDKLEVDSENKSTLNLKKIIYPISISIKYINKPKETIKVIIKR